MYRPKPGETEEDLLRFQEEFLRKQNVSSAKLTKNSDNKGEPSTKNPDPKTTLKRDVVKLDDSSTVSPGDVPRKKSKFKSSQRESNVSSSSSQRVYFDLDGNNHDNMHKEMDQRDSHITSVLSDIIERDIRDVPVYLPRAMNQAFPSAFHRGKQDDKRLKDVPEKKRPSLFAQHFSRTKPSEFGMISEMKQVEVPNVTSKIHSKTIDNVRNIAKNPESNESGQEEKMEVEENAVGQMASLPVTPLVITGEGLDQVESSKEAIKIHKENLTKLSEMPKAEILAEQKQLKSMLDPNIVAFLASKKQKTTSSPSMDTSNAETTAKIPHGNEQVVEQTMSSPKSGTSPITSRKGWVHMDTVEKEKLEWMQEVPKPKTGEKKIGVQARFNLHGVIIARDSDISMREGLHHHGEEPEVPGYTLEEMFQLCRSAALNQRILSLQILAKVLYNYRLDRLGGDLQVALIPHLLDAGLIFILRRSLDDTSEVGIAAAVDAFKSVLIQPADEECLDKVYGWYRGCEVHPLFLSKEEEDEEDADSNKKEKHEIEILEQDVIKGLLKMKFLERLRYILEICRPDPTVVINILLLLIRLARHSPEASHEIMKCPRLMSTIFTMFLPTTWTPTDRSIIDDVYGFPVHHAMKLVRVLCMAGRNIAAIILSRYNLMSVIIRYITQEPTDMQLHVGEAFMLSIESLYVWKACIMYSITSEFIRELYPMLMQYLQHFARISVLPRPGNEEKGTQALYELQLLRSSAVMGVLEASIHLGASVEELQAKQTVRPQEDVNERKPTIPVPAIDWSHVTGFIAPIELCYHRWITEISRTDEPLSDQGLMLAASCINAMSAFYIKITQQTSYNAPDVLQHIETIVDKTVLPFMKSGNFYNYVINLRTYSSYKINDEDRPRKTGCASLPDLSGHPLDDNRHPCIQNGSPYPFMISYLRLIYTWAKMHKGIAAKFAGTIESSYVITYLERTCENSRLVGDTLDRCYSRYEHIVLYYLVKLYQLVAEQTESCRRYSKLYHSVALLLFTSLHSGDEHLAHDLMSTVLFHTHYLVEGRIGDPEAIELAELLRVSDTSERTNTCDTMRKREPNRGVLLRDSYNSLPSIRACYMSSFGGMTQTIAKSRNLFTVIPHEIETFILPEFSGSLVPLDWMYLPLLHFYNQASKNELLGQPVENLPSQFVNGVTNTLRMIYMLETWRPESVNHISMSAKITRLMCVFLTGNDLFLEDTVHCYLLALLKLYFQPSYLDRLELNSPIPGVASFYDFYMVFVVQYGGVSFGDSLFATFMLLPLQQRYNIEFRKAIWGEHQHVIRAITLKIDECLLPMHRYLTPQESHVELLQLYLSALVSNVVKSTWSPVLYLIAVCHVNGFLFSRHDNQDQEMMKRQFIMLKQVLRIQNQELLQHLLYYKSYNKDASLGFDLYTELPQDRQQLLETLQY